MVEARPHKAEENLVKWTEFLAEFKELPNLEPYGVHLSFIQYHSLDVIGLLFAVLAVILGVVYLVLRYVVRKTLCIVSRWFSSPVKAKTQ